MPRITESLRDSRATLALAPAGATSLRSKIKGIRLRPDELQDICLAARACGLTPGEFMRNCALGQRIEAKPLVPQINAQTYAALGRVGGNINQIAAKLNASGQANDSLGLAMQQLIQLLKTVRGEVLGGQK